MEKSRVKELEMRIKEVSKEIEALKEENGLLEMDILKKRLMIQKIQLEQMKEEFM